MDCPRCGLANTPAAQRCDCGFDLSQPLEQMERSREQLVARHQQEMLVGALIAVGSLAGTVLSYVLAFGGRFWILWGGVVAGVLVFGRAHARWRSARGR